MGFVIISVSAYVKVKMSGGIPRKPDANLS